MATRGNQKGSDLYRGLMVIGLIVSTVLAVMALGVSQGWTVGLGAASAAVFAWSLMFLAVARQLEKDGEKDAG